jgi:hypothetical protein
MRRNVNDSAALINMATRIVNEPYDSDAELDEMLEGIIDEDSSETELKQKIKLLELAASNGLAVHRVLPHSDAAVVFIEKFQRVVCHVYDESSIFSASTDLFLEQLAPRFLGTAFCRVRYSISSEANKVLRQTKKGNIAVCRGGSAVATAQVVEFGDSQTGYIDKYRLQKWLEKTGVLSESPDLHERSIPADKYVEVDADGSEIDYFDCGLSGCKKTFRHDHIARGLPIDLVASSEAATIRSR